MEQEDIEQHRRCTQCNRNLLLEDNFYRDGERYKSKCKECISNLRQTVFHCDTCKGNVTWRNLKRHNESKKHLKFIQNVI